MKRITFDKIWKARKVGYSNEEASRGFYIDKNGGIRRIEIMDVFDSDIEAANYAKTEYGYKLINICLHYPYLMFSLDYMSILFIDTPATRAHLEIKNEELRETINSFIEDYFNGIDEI